MDELMDIMLPAELFKDPTTMQLPDPEMLVYYQTLLNRTIWIDDSISTYSLLYLKKILQWNKEDRDAGLAPEQRKPIRLMIFTPGGDLDVCRALGDVIDMSKTPIYGYNMGNAYSAGAFILMHCHKRYTLPSSTLLFHKGSASLGGNYGDIENFMETYQKQVKELSELVCGRTSYTEEEVSDKMKADWYIDAKEGLQRDVYDGIVDDIDSIM